MTKNLTEKKRNIKIKRRRAELFNNYPRIWDRMVEEWQATDNGSDRVWLTPRTICLEQAESGGL